MAQLKILMVAAEYAPLAKTGGLADAVAGLARYLAGQGHDVHVLLPDYRAVRPAGLEFLTEVGEASTAGGHKFQWRTIATNPGEPGLHLLDCPELFGSGPIYASGDHEARRFAFLSLAASRFCQISDWAPDIVHCHDWHAALLVHLIAQGRKERSLLGNAYTVLTLHNIGYQGEFDAAAFAAPDMDVPGEGSVNVLRLGIQAADALTTVSPTHAREILTPEYGMGLDADLAERSHRLVGILNGVDYSQWSPEQDPWIASRFSAADLSGKDICRRALAAELGLDAAEGTPIVGLVSRLVTQKGIDLLVSALPQLRQDHRFVCALLGDGDPAIAAGLSELASASPRQIAFVQGYDESLAHRIIAGSDLLFVPSRYEPCGLTQLYAMRYGTIPVVRKTGGLADSVTHFDPWQRVGTGAVFEHADANGLSWAASCAFEWLANPDARSTIIANAMAEDFSWQHQGREYESLYLRLAV
jgi:starch synthase